MFGPKRIFFLAAAALFVLSEAAHAGADQNAGRADWEKYATPKAEKIVVYKGERTLQLVRGGQIMRSYRIALGSNPVGPKMREGDGRTPEGRYFIDRRNMLSEYHLALHISYPDQTALRRASAEGAEPGGAIMIHGFPNYISVADRKLLKKDWTAGCIALTNPDIDEVWRLVEDGTEIDIFP